MTERAGIQIDAELLGRIIRLLRWSHDVALADAVLPDEEKARLIRETLERLDPLEREGGSAGGDRGRD